MSIMCGSCTSGNTQQQSIVALSSIEAEYIAATEAAKEAIWLKCLLKELKLLEQDVTVYTDSQNSVYLCKNSVFHQRSKHINVKHHFIQGCLGSRIVEV